MWLFLAFLLVPLIEIGLFIQVGGLIGLWPTLAIVILTAMLGTWLVRQQGARAMNDLRGSFSRLEDPSQPLAHGAMILLSGALLLTPGFFTDAVGFALLAPPIRTAIMRQLGKRVKVARFDMGGGFQDPRQQRPSQGTGDVIDGEYTEESQDTAPPKSPTHPGSGWTRH